MLIQKFGGTSIGTPERMQSVARIIRDHRQKIVVLSATSGTTNKLHAIAQSFYHEKEDAFTLEKVDRLDGYFRDFVQSLFESNDYVTKGHKVIDEHIEILKSFKNEGFNISNEKQILAIGELISTHLFDLLCAEQGINAILLSALDFMRIESGQPDQLYIKGMLNQLLKNVGSYQVYITQGYICKNEHDKIDNLRRGGSDYSAALIGAAIKAEEIQIWTDIDGVHNNDPRIVKNTQSIEKLSFDEAAELAYFGAKVLHPFSVRPAQKENIPVRLLNTMNPSAKGTLISSESISSRNIVKAIAAKDGITAIKIKSSRMLLAYGFLKRIFEIFEKYKTPIDLITTSEVAVSLTIDDSTYLDVILEELQQIAFVEIDKNQTIVCLVGQFRKTDIGIVNVLNTLKDIPIRMISLGGSEYNISILIDTTFKKQVLEKLHKHHFTVNMS